MKHCIKWFALAAIIAAVPVALSSCAEDPDADDVDYVESPADSDAQIAENLPGFWMQIGYTALRAEAGDGENQTVAFSGKDNTYRWMRLSVADDGLIEARWYGNDNKTVISSHTLRLDGKQLYMNEQLVATITKCVRKGSSSSDPELTIIWEKGAEPFNLGVAYRCESRYLRDTWSH